jgi:hypothetical protein
MVDRKSLEQSLTLITAIRPDGVITVKDGIGTVSHSDTASAAMVYTSFTIPFPDGEYGVDFEKMLTLVKAYKTKEIEVKITDKMISLRSGEIKNRMLLLNIPTLEKIRPKSVTPLPCIVEVNTAEILEVITFIEKISEVSRNSYLGTSLVFDGNNLSVVCPEADETNRSFELSQVIKGKGEKYESLFSFEYLCNLIKAIGNVNKDGKMTISIGNESPCRIETALVSYVIAHRIEDN